MSTEDITEPLREGCFETLRRAREELDSAYQRARSCGYEPGSRQMTALLLAEAQCERLERKHRRARST